MAVPKRVNSGLKRSPRRRGKNFNLWQISLIILTLVVVAAFVIHQLRTPFTRTATLNSSPELSTEDRASADTDKESDIVVLSTKLGEINIQLRPDLSKESSEYVKGVALQGCSDCQFYRISKGLLFQGKMENEDVKVTEKYGDCPPGAAEKARENCSEDELVDGECGECHGPAVVQRGMVGWAAGDLWPDFFIVTADDVTHWGAEHTIWGVVTDEDSFRVIEEAFKQPAQIKGKNKLNMLDENIKFTMRLK